MTRARSLTRLDSFCRKAVVLLLLNSEINITHLHLWGWTTDDASEHHQPFFPYDLHAPHILLLMI